MLISMIREGFDTNLFQVLYTNHRNWRAAVASRRVD
jgi:hypothetical protein